MDLKDTSSASESAEFTVAWDVVGIVVMDDAAGEKGEGNPGLPPSSSRRWAAARARRFWYAETAAAEEPAAKTLPSSTTTFRCVLFLLPTSSFLPLAGDRYLFFLCFDFGL